MTIIFNDRRSFGYRHKRQTAFAVLVLSFLTLIVFTIWHFSQERTVKIGRIALQSTEYVVKPGDFINTIAERQGAERELMIVANRSRLLAQFEHVCGRKSDQIRNNPSRKGLFCNDRYNRAYANTLLPGQTLDLPVAPVADSTMVAEIRKLPNGMITLLIDASSSMSDPHDLGAVINWITSIYATGREYQVMMYSDSSVYQVTDFGDLFVSPSGQKATTFEAIRTANKDAPGGIILVSDNEGEWPWFWDWRISLPPVIAHCLPGGVQADTNPGCRHAFEEIVDEAGGVLVVTD